MRKLRIALFFIFAALSSTWAQTFDILKNGELLTGNPAIAEFIYRDNDVFSVQPGEEWCWALAAAPTICFSETANYTPKILENPDADYILNIVITRKSDGASRLLNLTIKKRFCQIIWNFDNSQPNKTDLVPYGTLPALPPDPTKTSDAQYEYAFAGWAPAIAVATEPTTYTAQFTPTLRKYIITWNVEGSLTTTENNYGTTPAFGSTPKKASDIQYDYVFAGWNPVLTAVTGPATYTAQFTPTLRKYAVTWNVEGNFSTTQVDYGTMPVFSSTPTKESDIQYDYAFAGWSPALTAVTGLATYTAQFTPTLRKYAVTWKFDNGEPDAINLVEYGQTPTPPQNPSKAPTIAYTYAFAQWMPAPAVTVTEPITFTAQYTQTPIDYTITYNSNDGTDVPSSSYNIDSSPISLPLTTKFCIEFEGWYDNPSFTGKSIEIFTPSINNLGNKTFHAKWKDKMTPSASDLIYAIPTTAYNGAEQPITTPTLSSNATICYLSHPIIHYNGTNSLPKNAGNYAISASFAESLNYYAATISLGTLTIDKATIPSPNVSAIISDKDYDATTAAQVTNISLDVQLLGSDMISPSSYSIASANFSNPDAELAKSVAVAITWNLPNYNTQLWPPAFIATGNIMPATGYLSIKAPENYELSDPLKPMPSILAKNSFIRDEIITWEYRRIGNFDYSKDLPNRIGDWMVRASFNETDNYSGAADSVRFPVTRGNVTTVIHDITFKEASFEKDDALSRNQRSYFVANSCNIDNANINITVIEPDIILGLGNERPRGELDENGFIRYEIPFKFSKPGVGTFTYTLLSTDGNYSEQDTILMELPILFDSVAGQKWNNVLYIDNNPLTNGGYEFAEYQWFKNGNAVSEMQFYSAGPSSADILNTKDIYKVTMHTADGMRISTCEGSPLAPKAKSEETGLYKKQVLGINGKTTKIGAKIYNLKGSKTEKTPAGIYIVGENE